MYTNNAYLNNSTVDRKDKSKPLVITMCGTYKLYTKPKLPTWRPRGRLDFQLLYIAAGKAHFHFGSDTEETIVPAGHMVLYRPKEPQKYEYYANDQTEVFWVHFTGNNVTNLLRSYGLTNDKKVFYCGFDSEYKTLFQSMIKELQMCQDGYPEMLEMYLRQIFIKLKRHFHSSITITSSRTAAEIDGAVSYFSEHYNEQINIDDYAKQNFVSTSWLIRNFRLYTQLLFNLLHKGILPFLSTILYITIAMPQSVMPKLLNPFLKEIILVLIMLEMRLKECFIQHIRLF